MYLLLTEMGHLGLSLFAGYVCYRLCKRRISYVLAIISGFLVDFDHYVDFLLWGGKWYDLAGFLSGTQYNLGAPCYIVFHSWELVLLLGVLTVISKKKYIFCALLLGLIFHLIWDYVTNPAYWYAYFWIGRFLNGFDLARIFAC